MAKTGRWARTAHRAGLVVSGCVLAAALAGSASAVDPTFTQAAGSPIATGSGAIGVAIAEFNGDSRPDLAIANQGDGNVSILLGNGNGTFGAPTNFSVGIDPVAVVAANLNGAGGLDLAVANEDLTGLGTVSILLGDGSGGFTNASGSPITIGPVGSGPQGIAIADLNGAGGLDLAVVSEGTNDVSILLGNGNGTFGAPTSFAVGTTPQALVAANLNGAGGVDLAVANEVSGNVSILLGNGNGTFGAATNFAAGVDPNDIAVADLNGAGGLDLIVANAGGDNVSILLGNGSGGFGAPTNFAVGVSPEGVTAADFNLDGKRDLAVANAGGTTLSILVGNGLGGFTPAPGPPVTADGAPTGIAAADLTGDTKPDVVAANYDTGNVTVQLNTTPAPPTAVMLRSFAARATPKGIELRWRTGHEAGLLGFHVFRAGVKLNRRLIAARGAGTAYRLVDRSVRLDATSIYRLQAVRDDGRRAWIGRVLCPPKG